MTETTETSVENVEFLRTRLRELKSQARDDLEVLRRDRDQMREYKRVRDEHNKEVRALIESVKAEREERDRINKDITEAKDRRTAIHAQLKSVYDDIREMRGSLVGSPSNDQRRMMRRVEELEWRQQTDQLSMDEERSIVEEIAKIESKLVQIGQEKEKQDRIMELRRLARNLKNEASDAHKKVLELSESSQVHHQEVVRIRPQLEEYKKSADTAHQNFVEWLKKVKEGETTLKTVRTEIDDIQGKIRKHSSTHKDVERTERRQKQKAHEQERIDDAVGKLKSGKRLTFDEFILARRADDDKGRKKSQKQKKRAQAAEAAEIDTAPAESIVEEPVEKAETEVEATEPEATESPIEESTEESEAPAEKDE
ncbi:MAG: coiled-coil protein [Candidatus Thorarchaeota archaeon]